MADIFDFASTAGGNNISVGAGSLFPEGIAAAVLSDNLRELQAAERRRWNDAEFFPFGSGSGSPVFTFISSTQFRVTGDVRAQYETGRRVRAVGTVTGTIFGTITATSFAGATTTVTCEFDSGGELKSDSDLIISLGIITTKSLPKAVATVSPGTGGQSVTGNLAVTGDAEIGGKVRSGGREISRVVQMRAYEDPGGTTAAGSFAVISGSFAFTPRRTDTQLLIEVTGKATATAASGVTAGAEIAIFNAGGVAQSAALLHQTLHGASTSSVLIGGFSLRTRLAPASTATLTLQLRGRVTAGTSMAAENLIVSITEFLDS